MPDDRQSTLVGSCWLATLTPGSGPGESVFIKPETEAEKERDFMCGIAGAAWTRRSAAIDSSPLRGRLFPPFVSGHDSEHELIKQRHGESCVAVRGTPDHSFRDQVVASRPERTDFAIEYFSDLS